VPRLSLQVLEDAAPAPPAEEQPPAAAGAALPPIPVESWIQVSHAADSVAFDSAEGPFAPGFEVGASQKQPGTSTPFVYFAPVPVESWLSVSHAAEWLDYAAPAAARFEANLSAPVAIVETTLEQPAEPDPEFVATDWASLPPLPVETWVDTSQATTWLEAETAPVILFEGGIAAASPGLAAAVAGPQATEVASFITASSALELAVLPAELYKPAFDAAVVADGSAPRAEDLVEVVDICEQWMPVPPAEPVTSFVAWSESAGFLSTLAIRTPELAAFAVTETFVPRSMRLARPKAPEPVVRFVYPTDSARAIAPEPALLRGTDPIFDVAPDQASYVDGPQPMPVESMPAQQVIEPAVAAIAPITGIGDNKMPEASCTTGHRPAGYAPVPVEDFVFPSHYAAMMSTSEVALPAFEIAASSDRVAPVLEAAPDAAALPAAQAPALKSKPPAPEPIRTLTLVRPQTDAGKRMVAVPERGFVQLEYYCQRPTTSASSDLEWRVANAPLLLAPFAVRPAFEKADEAPAAKKPVQKPNMAEIFRLPQTKRKAANPAVHYAMKAIAASVAMGGILWFGVGAIRIGKQTPAVNRDVSMMEHSVENAVDVQKTTTATVSQPSSQQPAAAPEQSPGTFAKFRRVISDRAAATVTDSFRNGMEAWGTKSKTWAAGWSRHPEGYVQPGQLAIFNPTVKYTDYHLEFFGQIDNKSMGWTVRSKDTKNYYAMKFSVVEAGLRPIIAMVHYPVVGGKRGKPVETPLNVMVHNNRPFQVAVDVKGNRMVTSVDGQEVDTWIEDSIGQGGVGFFADAGEKARLYWMKVSKNEDFLGRVCAYLSSKLGDGSNTSAEMWAPELPGSAPYPGSQIPASSNEAAVSAAVVVVGRRRRHFGQVQRIVSESLGSGGVTVWSS
jgi:hypothetical protein